MLPAGLLIAGWLLFDLTRSMSIQSTSVPWLHTGAAFILNLLYVCVYGLMWHRVTRVHGVQIEVQGALAVYLYSNVGKYLPMKVAGMALRIALYAKKYGRDVFTTTNAVYCEGLAVLIGGLAVVIVSLPVIDKFLPQIAYPSWAYGLLGIVLVLMLLPVTQRLLVKGIGIILRRELLYVPVQISRYLSLIFGYAICWVLLGASLFAICAGLGAEAEMTTAQIAVAAYSVAGIAGMISVIVPAGIGVREGVMVVGLMPILDTEGAVVAALLARIVITVAELIGIVFGAVYLDILNDSDARSDQPGPAIKDRM